MKEPRGQPKKSGLLNRISDFTGNELKAWLLIFRKTIGFKKKRDWISNSQFHYLAGIGHNQVTQVIDSLVAKREILVTDIAGKSLRTPESRRRKKLFYSLIPKLIPKEVLDNPIYHPFEYMQIGNIQIIEKKTYNREKNQQGQDLTNPSLTGRKEKEKSLAPKKKKKYRNLKTYDYRTGRSA